MGGGMMLMQLATGSAPTLFKQLHTFESSPQKFKKETLRSAHYV